MPHQLTESVKILQKCAIWSGDRVLLLKRADDAHSRPGQWDLPGGNAEWPAAHKDLKNPHIKDIQREIQEETGFEVSLDEAEQPIFVASYFAAEDTVYSIILGWKYNLIDTDQPAPQVSSEHSDFAWISIEELDQYDFGFAGGETGFISKIIRYSR
ncbi:MAG: NUDIX domain-containing protein [Patescibacteria group bacterium]